MSLPQEVITTLYAEGTALALIIGLVVYTFSLKKKNGVREHIFGILCVHVILLSVSGAASYALRYQDFGGALLLAKVLRNLHELCVLGFLFYWMLFTDYLLYRSRDHLFRRYRPAFIPIVICTVLLVINSFTYFLFDIGEDLKFSPKPAYWVLVALEYLYLINTVVLLFGFYAKSEGPRFIRILPFVVPFVTGSILNRVTPYEVRSLGIAVGLVLIHFSLMNERCYMDEETGFYNIAFLRYIAGFAAEHEASGGCSIVLDGAERGDELAAIISEEVPDDSAVINMGHGRYLVLSGTQSKSGINLFITAVKEAAREKDMEVSAEYSIRDDADSGADFIKRIINSERTA